MKVRHLFSLFILMSLTLFGQSSDIKVIEDQKIIGQNVVTQQDIIAKKYQFPKAIYKHFFNATTGNLTLQLRKLKKSGKAYALQGQIVAFNLNSNTVQWSRKMNYALGVVNQNGNLITVSRENKIQYLDGETGNELWTDKNDIYYVNQQNNIGLQYIKNNNSKIQGINLSTGNVLWNRDITREYGWDNIITINDSLVIIAAGGLHALNIKNGKGWDYNTVTGKKDYTETIAKNTLGIAIGVLTGTAVISTGSNLVRDLSSNVLVDNDYAYFASKEKISKINTNTGEVIWTQPLDEKISSKSLLFLKDNSIFMLNQGYGNFRNRKVNEGDPFLFAFNTETGEQEIFRTILTKDDFILDYKLVDDNLLLVLKDKIIRLTINNTDDFKEKIINSDTYGELKYFTKREMVYRHEDLGLSDIVVTNPTQYFAQTNKGLTLELDRNLEITNQYSIDDLYIYYNTFKDYKFFIKGDRSNTLIVDKVNHIIADIKAPRYINGFGEKLYTIDGKKLSILQLKDLSALQ